MCILLGVCPLTHDTLGRAAGMKDGLYPWSPNLRDKVCVSTPGSGRKPGCWFIVLLLQILFEGRLCKILNVNQMKAIPWVSGSRAALGACGCVTPYNYTSVGEGPRNLGCWWAGDAWLSICSAPLGLEWISSV